MHLSCNNNIESCNQYSQVTKMAIYKHNESVVGSLNIPYCVLNFKTFFYLLTYNSHYIHNASII